MNYSQCWALPLLLVISIFGSVHAQEVAPRQQALITKRTATWCTICGLESWDTYKGIVETLQDRSLVIAAHESRSSDLYAPVGEALIDNFEASFGQPFYYFNEEIIGRGDQSTADSIIARVERAEAQFPLAQSALEAFYDPALDKLYIETALEFFQDTSGTYHMGVYLIRGNYVGPQANRGSQAEHKHVLHSSFTGLPFGPELLSGQIAVGDRWSGAVEMFLPEEIDTADVMIAAIIWKAAGERFEYVNSNFTYDLQPLMANSVSETTLANAMIVRNNPTPDQAVLELRLPESLPDAEVALFDLSGKKLSTIHRGGLAEGDHTFTVSVKNYPEGTYLLRLQTPKAIASRMLVHLSSD